MLRNCFLRKEFFFVFFLFFQDFSQIGSGGEHTDEVSQIDDHSRKDLDSCEVNPATTLDPADELAGDENTFSDIDDDEVSNLCGVFLQSKSTCCSMKL